MNPTTIAVAGLKVAVTLGADQLPRAGLAPEGQPQPDVMLDLTLPGESLTVRARIGGKSYRRTIKQVAELGADAVVILLQGKVIPPVAQGEPFQLEGAGISVTVKTPKPGP
jgi:hypothetical protein